MSFWIFKKKKIEPIIEVEIEDPIPDYYSLINSQLVNVKGKVLGEHNLILLENTVIEESSIEITGNNNTITIINAGELKGIKIEIHGDNHRIELNDAISITNTKMFMRGYEHRLKIGKCRIMGGVLWFESKKCEINIDDQTTIDSSGLIAVEPFDKILIGQDCMISHNVTIRTSDSHPIYDNETKERINHSQNVLIGNHVWIGAYCNILKGITILDNSVVGIGSLVTKDVSSNTLVAGNPAKIIKQDIFWNREVM